VISARRAIEIVPYDPGWPERFQQEQALIVSAIGAHVVQIEHVGSTAVPGLAAKPVIDIMIGIAALERAPQCIAPLERLGYAYVPEHEQQMPYRRFFHKDTAGRRSHHLHLVETSHEFWSRHLLFRDYLRRHGDTMQAYAALKREFAMRYVDDMAGYTDAKAAFIQHVERRAREGT
jgi:GrpB-like predicted nucleotidyltransferase (UPF0157 family)